MSTASRAELDDLAARVQALPGIDNAIVVPHTVIVRRQVDQPARRERAETDATVPVAESGDGYQAGAELYGGDLRLGDTDPTTLREALLAAAEQAPAKGTTYVREGSSYFQSYDELLHDARRALSGLRNIGITPGDSVLLQLGDNQKFITAFWACVLGGYLPTPVAIAQGYSEENPVVRKLRNAWELLDHPLVLTDDTLLGDISALSQPWRAEDLRVESVDHMLENEPDPHDYPAGADDDVLQLLTSGSTGIPKCVRHKNRSIIARTKATILTNGFTADEVSLNFMPLDHVGGIVMYNVRDTFLQCHHVNAEIGDFLADPLRWLDWTSRFRVTNTWAPNFAFALINELADAMRERTWDLSSLRHICNGGEAVVSRTAHCFLAMLRQYGLPADAMRPSWGMSETSSGVTFSILSREDMRFGTIRVDKRSLGGRIRRVAEAARDGITLTEVGAPIPGVRLRIVDTENTILPDGYVGRLQVAGATLMAGYYGNPEANEESFTVDGWFNTGDLGFINGGKLTITGREKDVIVIRGVNYLTYDIESVVEGVEGTETTYVAACGYIPQGSQTEELVVFFVPMHEESSDLFRVVREIRGTLSRELGLEAHLVIPVPRARFSKTSSGKIQRAQLIRDLEDGEFAERLAALSIDDDRDDVLFERVWLPQEAQQLKARVHDGAWLLLTDDQGVMDALSTATPSLVRAAADVDIPALMREHPRLQALILHSYDTMRVLAALQALVNTSIPLVVLTLNGVWTMQGDEVDLRYATIPGLVRTALAEECLPWVRQVDLPVDKPESWGTAIRTELASADATAVVAYRDHRLVPRLRPVEAQRVGIPAFVTNGTYLVTGGLGGIGRLVSEHLLAAYGARLVIVGRTPDPDMADLSVLGEVEYVAGDAADGALLRVAAERAERRWAQPLAGVLHLACPDMSDHWDNAEQHTLLSERPSTFREIYGTKVTGTLAIADLLADRPDAMLVCFSSVNAEFGGSSFGAYSSANSFLNGFADYWTHCRGRKACSLSWSMWAGIGMSRDMDSNPAAERRGFRALSAEAGIAGLTDALALGHPNLIVGLNARNPHVLREMIPEQLTTAEVIVAYTASGEINASQLRSIGAGHRTPVRFLHVDEIPADPHDVLTTVLSRNGPYIKPATALEAELAAVWSDVLKHPRISRNDSFFELGGNSMQAVQVVSRIAKALDIHVAVQHLYKNPTIGEFADALSQRTLEAG